MINRYDKNNKILIKIMKKIMSKLQKNDKISMDMSPLDYNYSYSLYFNKKSDTYCLNLQKFKGNDIFFYIKVFYMRKSDSEWSLICDRAIRTKDIEIDDYIYNRSQNEIKIVELAGEIYSILNDKFGKFTEKQDKILEKMVNII